jgi:hypothetical protein
MYYYCIPTYSCIQDWATSDTNITLDPLLVDPEGGDFHLQPGSPCIDAGGTCSLGEDFDGDSRPQDMSTVARGDGSDFDIGADEFGYPKAAAQPRWRFYD